MPGSVYVDTSVIVRIVTGEAHPLTGLDGFEKHIASVIIEVEMPRAIDALRRNRRLTGAAAARALANGRRLLQGFHLVEIDALVRQRAGGPLGASVRSLDAIHLASALQWREQRSAEELTLATHDERLAQAAEASGFVVIGWPEPTL
jgi:predicted nucleic acid-binding protein